MPRIFVAVPLPDAVAAELARVLPALPGLRPVAPELLHITLAFVWQMPEEGVAAAVAAARSAARASSAFPLALTSLGRFPHRGRPGTVWAGAGAGAEALERLALAVRGELGRREVPFDPKPFRPHATLARVREAATDAEARAIGAAVAAARIEHDLSFRVAGLRVVESRLSAGGPLYSSRAEVPLQDR